MCSVFFSVCRNLNASGREGFWTSKFLWLFFFLFFLRRSFPAVANVWLWIPLQMISIFHSILLLSYFAKFSLVSHKTAAVSGMQARFVNLYVSCDSNIFIFVLFNGKITLKLVWKLHLFWGSTGYCMPGCYFIRSAGNGLTSYHCFCI